MIPLVDVLTRTETFFRERGIDSPRLEAELVLAHVLGLKRLEIYLQYDRPLTDADLDAIRPLVARRGRREPLAWILGSAGFHALDLKVLPGVLVPRPDTEVLVEAALEWLDPNQDPLYVADVGCGSGAVGLAIAHALPGVRLFATDLSDEALATTKANVALNGLSERVAVLKGDLISPIPPLRPLDWVVSNPPYIPTEELAGLMPEVSKFEPRLALDGGPDGLDVYRRLIPLAGHRVQKGLLLEVGYQQAGRVVEIMARSGFTDIRTWDDTKAIKRVVGGRRAPVR